MIIHSCHDCGVEEGKLHQEGCDWEVCPRCKRQLLSCPKHDWKGLKDEEREPYFSKEILICARCGKFYPEMFMIPNQEWEEICGITYDKEDMLCKECMLFIKSKREENAV